MKAESQNQGQITQVTDFALFWYGSLGESDAKNEGLNSLTYISPLEWECPPPQNLWAT